MMSALILSISLCLLPECPQKNSPIATDLPIAVFASEKICNEAKEKALTDAHHYDLECREWHGYR